MFHPKVCLELKSGQILTSECDCEASEAGQCGHVAALLYCLLDLFAKPKPKPLKVKKACTETVNAYPYFISRDLHEKNLEMHEPFNSLLTLFYSCTNF